jgi:thymidylate synthase ThyX
MRQRLNLTIHPEIRAYAEAMAEKRRRSISQIFEELVEAEWERRHGKVTALPEQSSSVKPTAKKSKK